MEDKYYTCQRLWDDKHCPNEQKSDLNMAYPETLLVCDWCGLVKKLKDGLCENCQKELKNEM